MRGLFADDERNMNLSSGKEGGAQANPE